MIVHFSIIEFLFIIFFVIFVPRFLFQSSFATFLLDMSNIVAVMTFWYVLSTLSMPEVFYFVPKSPESLAGTLVLRFYVKGFFIFY